MSVDRQPVQQAQDKYVVRLPEGMRERLKAEALANARSMNAEIVWLIEKGMASPPVAAPTPLASAPPLAGLQGELFPLPDLDALERMVGIVERTNRIFGVSAARRLWPMLGLPDLRTSEVGDSDADACRSVRGKLEAVSADRAPDGVRGPKYLRTSPELHAEKKFTPSPKEMVSRFLDECCEIDPKSELPGVVFRERYLRWALANGAPSILASSFGRYAANLGVRKRKASGRSHYVGLRIKSEASA